MKQILLVALLAPTSAFAGAPAYFETHGDCAMQMADAYEIKARLDLQAQTLENSSMQGVLQDAVPVTYQSLTKAGEAMDAYIATLANTCEKLR